jgi:hypothetical protein
MTPTDTRGEPPFILDGALVVEYAPFDAEMKSARRTSGVLGGVAVDLLNVFGLAIVEELAKGDRYLLLCDQDWATLAAEPCGDVATARTRGESVFPGAGRLWRPYRELTDEERREVNSTRAFLRDLVADEPDA